MSLKVIAWRGCALQNGLGPREFGAIAGLNHPAYRSARSECPACPLAAGEPLGCIRVLPTPLSAGLERAIFQHFIHELDREGSPAKMLYESLIWHRRGHPENPWLTKRPGLTECAIPPTAQTPDEVYLSSGDVLWPLLSPTDTPALIEVMWGFWVGLEAAGRHDALVSSMRELLGRLHQSELRRPQLRIKISGRNTARRPLRTTRGSAPR